MIFALVAGDQTFALPISSPVRHFPASTQKRPSARGSRLRRGFGVRQPFVTSGLLPSRDLKKALRQMLASKRGQRNALMESKLGKIGRASCRERVCQYV